MSADYFAIYAALQSFVNFLYLVSIWRTISKNDRNEKDD